MTKRHPSIADTVKLAYYLHDGQEDKAGFPYWTHPMRVLMRLPNDATAVEKHSALLHDACEDCGITGIYLARRGYGPEVIRCVGLLTHDANMTRRGYEDRITQSGNKDAIRVKLSDVYDNSAPGRVAFLDKSLHDAHFLRYQILATRLTGALFKMDPTVLLPYEGDPQPGTPLAGYWHPYLREEYAVPAFAAHCNMDRFLSQGVFL